MAMVVHILITDAMNLGYSDKTERLRTKILFHTNVIAFPDGSTRSFLQYEFAASTDKRLIIPS